MIVLAIILNAAFGGIWRRALGGWLGLRRPYIVAAGFLLTWPIWFALPWWGAALASGAAMAFWTLGHRFDSANIVLRYPVFGIVYRIGERYWPANYTEVAEVVIGAAFWGGIALVMALK